MSYSGIAYNNSKTNKQKKIEAVALSRELMTKSNNQLRTVSKECQLLLLLLLVLQ